MAYSAIDKSSSFMSANIHTGTGSSQAITGVGHQPDLCWFKKRDGTTEHQLYDSVRTATKVISSQSTDAEWTESTGLTAFDSDGYTLGGASGTNGSSNTYANWSWKAGTTGSGTSTGSGTGKAYSYSVNTTSGFSIIKYVGNGTTGHTIPHHLGAVPQVVLVKCLDQTYNWLMYHKRVGNTRAMYLNTTSAEVDSDSFWNDTTPSSTVFTLGSDNATNQNDQNYIAYVWTEKVGYSKVGYYDGNAGTGVNVNNFQYCGFKPTWVLMKCTSHAEGWNLIDSARVGYNHFNWSLYPQSNSAEGNDGANGVQIYSNGFNPTYGTGHINKSGKSYIWIAFGQPLTGSNNVPCTGR